MADQVDSMSDAELRTKLAEHGFPIMPITASTRKLLVKKLKLVLDNKSKQKSTDSKAENRRSLARYSSGEESDLDNSNAREKRAPRRQTTGGAMLPPAAAKPRRTPSKKGPAAPDDRDDSEEEKPPVRTHEEVETVTTRRVTRTYGRDDEYETGSDSDVDADKNSSPRSHSRSSDRISSTFPTADAGTSPPKTSLFSRPSISPTNYSSSYLSNLPSSDNLNSIRARLGLTSNSGERPSLGTYTSSFTPTSYQPSTSTIDEVESPYLSNFTRRLSALKPEAPKPSTFLDRDLINGAPVPRRPYAGLARADDYKASSDKTFLKNNLVSCALVGVTTLFFFFLFLMYIVKRNDIASVVDDRNSVIPLCQLNKPDNRPGLNCVPREQVDYAKDLLKYIHPELTARVAAFKCGEPNSLPYLTEREILDIAGRRADAPDAAQCRTDLHNLQVLLVNNPRWGLAPVRLQRPYSGDPEFAPVLSTDTLVQLRSQGMLALALTDAATPLHCLLLNAAYSAGSTAVVAALLAAAALGLQRAYRYWRRVRARRTQEVYALVEQIVELVAAETEDSEEPYVSVEHVRDTLLPPHERGARARVWDEAVRFLQANESRVRTEVRRVDGEECRVWRWVAARAPAWQGRAFQQRAVDAPTPCLKIRHMAEPGAAADRAALTDAILDKCGDCRVLHVGAEAGAVYVKCASAADAGRVYRALHGWWFEGRLITVKYVRLERYMQRFPDSPSGPPYLQPSRRPTMPA